MLTLHKTYDHWAVAVLKVTEHFIYSHSWFFLKLVAFCTEFNLFTRICFVLFMIMDFPYICDHQVGYSPGGYLLYPRWFLTWYIYPFFKDWLHWWVLILDKTYDHWSVVVSTVTEHFIYSHFWIFQIGCFLHWIPSSYLHLFFSLDDNRFPLYLWSPSGLLCWWIMIFPRAFLTFYLYPFLQDWLHWWVLILHKTYDNWSVAILTVTEHFIDSHIWFFFKFVFLCTKFNLFPPLVLFSLW